MPEFQRWGARVLQTFIRLCSAALRMRKGCRQGKPAQPLIVRDTFERFLEEFRSHSAIEERSEASKKKPI